MPKLSPSRLEARREGILRAALRCLDRRGLARTGMRDLFRAANLSPGAVYRYFSGKEELIAAVAERAPGPLEALSPGAGAEAPAEQRLAAALAAIAGAPGNRLRLELRAAARRSPAVAAALRRHRRRDRRRLAAMLAPEGGSAAPAELAELVLALGEGLGLVALLEPEIDLGPLCAAAARRLAG